MPIRAREAVEADRMGAAVLYRAEGGSVPLLRSSHAAPLREYHVARQHVAAEHGMLDMNVRFWLFSGVD